MHDPIAQITNLMQDGYTLYLHRDHTGLCSADLSRGWLFKKRVRLRLNRRQFDEAKELLADPVRLRVKLARQ